MIGGIEGNIEVTTHELIQMSLSSFMAEVRQSINQADGHWLGGIGSFWLLASILSCQKSWKSFAKLHFCSFHMEPSLKQF